MRRSKLVSCNNKERTTRAKANFVQGLISNVMGHLLGTRTRGMVPGMVVDMVTITTTPNRAALQILRFPSLVPLLVVYCWATYWVVFEYPHFLHFVSE